MAAAAATAVEEEEEEEEQRGLHRGNEYSALPEGCRGAARLSTGVEGFWVSLSQEERCHNEADGCDLLAFRAFSSAFYVISGQPKQEKAEPRAAGHLVFERVRHDVGQECESENLRTEAVIFLRVIPCSHQKGLKPVGITIIIL
eukprot:scaffold172936_cov15-Tisochrysis_lutea.AAC.1